LGIQQNNPHTLDELKDNIRVEISRITREELHCVAGNIFRRCEACLQAEGRHFDILLKDKVGFVSGKPAGSFSVSGPPLYGKEAAAVSETSLHIKRTPRIITALQMMIIPLDVHGICGFTVAVVTTHTF
jgi:hypothetical protein